MELVNARRGHFRLESGHHSGLWLDLDPLFINTRRIEPFVSALAGAVRPHGVDAVCGPMQGGAFLAQLVAAAMGIDFYFTERARDDAGSGLFGARYSLPPALANRVRGARVAMVDDVMSAGSALRGTFAALQSAGAQPVVAGALLVLGTTGADYFVERGLPVEAVARDEFPHWTPAVCPLCRDDVAIEDLASAPPP